VERRKLTTEEINAALFELSDWDVTETGHLHRKFKFDNFQDALELVNKVGGIAEKHDHHPDICMGWGYADISLITHDRGGLTDFDLTLAKEIDEI
jgi:4a-hydroxytetrahydrobiopterin dehydratase